MRFRQRTTPGGCGTQDPPSHRKLSSVCLPTTFSRSGSVDRSNAGRLATRLLSRPVSFITVCHAEVRFDRGVSRRVGRRLRHALPTASEKAPAKEASPPDRQLLALWSLEILMRSTALSQSRPGSSSLEERTPEDLAHRPGAEAERRALGPGPRPAQDPRSVVRVP
jgi:hypothetical protein